MLVESLTDPDNSLQRNRSGKSDIRNLSVIKLSQEGDRRDLIYKEMEGDTDERNGNMVRLGSRTEDLWEG
ncbi:hypothetical protein L2E82_00941 [Cichorium intybus]|uniref:Uncharacterized protein n=1 Tax=Cichorium intybus TaxID=13427 RepID=A0ACB9GXK9_CICIN|nr:hypothetical protein L2E82_00941 [Cichorium intybus]